VKHNGEIKKDSLTYEGHIVMYCLSSCRQPSGGDYPPSEFEEAVSNGLIPSHNQRATSYKMLHRDMLKHFGMIVANQYYIQKEQHIKCRDCLLLFSLESSILQIHLKT
jgi:hypothetical protein